MGIHFYYEEIRDARRQSIEMIGSPHWKDLHEDYLEVWHFFFMNMNRELKQNFSRLFPAEPPHNIRIDKGYRDWRHAPELDTLSAGPIQIARHKVGFSIGHDDGVIETTSWHGGHKLKNLRDVAKALNVLIFESALNAGLTPYTSSGVGGGHINIGIKPFVTHPKGGLWFAKTLISLINEYEIYQGLLAPPNWRNARPYQAPPHPLYPDQGRWHQVLNFIEKVNQLGPTPSFGDVWDIAADTSHFGRPHAPWVGGNYIDDRPIVIRGVGEQRRIEIRGIAPQASFFSFLDQAELFENLFNQLQAIDTLLEPRSAESELTPNRPLPKEELIESFRRISKGLAPDVAQRVLPEHLQSLYLTPVPNKQNNQPGLFRSCRRLIGSIF